MLHNEIVDEFEEMKAFARSGIAIQIVIFKKKLVCGFAYHAVFMCVLVCA